MEQYHQKKNWNHVPQPLEKKQIRTIKDLRFVIQKHSTKEDCFQLRLEIDGKFKSWSVPNGVSLNPLDQRSAVIAEDQPLEFGTFEGKLTKNGVSEGILIWDYGFYRSKQNATRAQSELLMSQFFKNGRLTFSLYGKRLKGEFILVQSPTGESDSTWLLSKKKDRFSLNKNPIVEDSSAKSGRTLREIMTATTPLSQLAKKKNLSSPSTLGSQNPWRQDRPDRQDRQDRQNRQEPQERLVRQEQPELHPQNQHKLRPLFDSKKPDVLIAKFKRMIQNYDLEVFCEEEDMPSRIDFMFPVYVNGCIKADKWIYEPWYEGERVAAHIHQGHAELYSRSFISLKDKFNEIYQDLQTIDCDVIFDGDIAKSEKDGTFVFYISDLLHFEGENLRIQPLKRRLDILHKNFSDTSYLKFVEQKPLEQLDGSLKARFGLSTYEKGVQNDFMCVKQVLAQKFDDITQEPLAFTNLDRVFWKEEGYSKHDLIEYYESVCDQLLPFIKDRPLALNPLPYGIAGKAAIWKEMIAHFPSWLRVEPILQADGTVEPYLICDNRESFLFAVNLGCVEITPWASKITSLQNPDFAIIEIEPFDSMGFLEAMEVALVIKKTLESQGLSCVAKTSGAAGLEILIPLEKNKTFEDAFLLAETICKKTEEELIDRVNLDRQASKQQRKVFLDYSKNQYGQGILAPYSLRPFKNAPVSAPICFSELDMELHPNHFRLENMFRRLRDKKDPWQQIIF